MIPAPWSRLEPPARRLAFAAAATAAALTMAAVLWWVGRPFEATGKSMVDFELAGDGASARAILDQWGEAGRAAADLQLKLDYLFMIAYGLAFSMNCELAAGWWSRVSRRLAAIGPWLAWGSILAAALDAVENFALFRVMAGAAGDGWPALSKWCAAIKFILILYLALPYILGGFLVRLFRGAAPGKSRAA